jgi:hypothetical protein
VFFSLNLFLILSEKYPWNASIARIFCCYDNTPGWCSDTYPSQSSDFK